VERAIDLAYASHRVFPDSRIFLIGEIIHNPEVNRQLVDMGIVSLPWQEMNESYDQLTEDDVVITDSGHHVLTAGLARSADEIEQEMNAVR
jgi:4-hydroxy-3-methylbut-2-enyl diphosphate reductase